MANSEDALKLLNNGWMIILAENAMGNILAVAFKQDSRTGTQIWKRIEALPDLSRQLTDDFTVDKALSRLADKVLGNGSYRDWEEKTKHLKTEDDANGE